MCCASGPCEIDVPLRIEGEDFKAYEQLGRLIYEDESRLLALPLPRLVGSHQINNAGVSVAAALSLPNSSPHKNRWKRPCGKSPGPPVCNCWKPKNWPPISSLIPIVRSGLDGGHNRAAAEVLAASMADLEEQLSRPLHLVIGMMQRKNAAEFLQVFEGLCEMVFTVPVPATIRQMAGLPMSL